LMKYPNNPGLSGSQSHQAWHSSSSPRTDSHMPPRETAPPAGTHTTADTPESAPALTTTKRIIQSSHLPWPESGACTPAASA
jgi:hypothetical protein